MIPRYSQPHGHGHCFLIKSLSLPPSLSPLPPPVPVTRRRECGGAGGKQEKKLGRVLVCLKLLTCTFAISSRLVVSEEAEEAEGDEEDEKTGKRRFIIQHICVRMRYG